MFEHSCLCPAASFAGKNSPPFLCLVNSYSYSKSQLNYHQLCETSPSSRRQNELVFLVYDYHMGLLLVSARL